MAGRPGDSPCEPAGEGAHDRDCIVLCSDPYIMANWNASGDEVNGTTVTIGAAQNTPESGTTTGTAKPLDIDGDSILVLEISSLVDASDDGGHLDLHLVHVTSFGGVER